MLNYVGTVIRPPSEHASLILQATLGCPDNNCIFCPAYKTKPFKIKSLAEIEKEILYAARKYPGTSKIFLADGSTLAMPFNDLLKVIDLLNANFPRLRRISTYANAGSVLSKSLPELEALKSKKMSLAYIGFETGDDEVYKFTRKAGTPRSNVDAALKLKQAGIKVNATVILGLGGKALSMQNAIGTAKVLNEAKPEQIAALTLMIPPEAPLYKLVSSGEFTPLTPIEMVNELGMLVANMENFPCLFFANHASNYVPVEARFPKDKPALLNTLKDVSHSDLRPDFLRGL